MYTHTNHWPFTLVSLKFVFLLKLWVQKNNSRCWLRNSKPIHSTRSPIVSDILERIWEIIETNDYSTIPLGYWIDWLHLRNSTWKKSVTPIGFKENLWKWYLAHQLKLLLTFVLHVWNLEKRPSFCFVVHWFFMNLVWIFEKIEIRKTKTFHEIQINFIIEKLRESFFSFENFAHNGPLIEKFGVANLKEKKLNWFPVKCVCVVYGCRLVKIFLYTGAYYTSEDYFFGWDTKKSS